MAVRTPAYKRPSCPSVMKTNIKKPAQYVRKQEKPSMQRHGNDKDKVHPTMTLVELHCMPEHDLHPIIHNMSAMRDRRSMRFTECSHCGCTMKHHVGRVKRVNTCNNYKCAMYRKSPAKKIDIVIQHGKSHG
eukprot:5802574-Amphidinium_carterae.1